MQAFIILHHSTTFSHQVPTRGHSLTDRVSGYPVCTYAVPVDTYMIIINILCRSHSDVYVEFL